jgi:hypothetical protein
MLCQSREAPKEWNLLSDSRILKFLSEHWIYIYIKYKHAAMHQCLAYFQFTLHTASFLYHKCRTGIMETYWCSKKNSIVNWINHGIDFTSELVPCKGLGCPEWRKWEGRGGCILLIKNGKHGNR